MKTVSPQREQSATRIWTNLPSEVQECAQFVTWRHEEINGRRTKVLYGALTGRRASSTNPSTWCAFKTAFAAYLYFPFYDGIGFVFSETDPYCGVDLDHCVEGGLLSDEALEIVSALESYSELSPSGSGVHIILRAKLPPGRRRVGWIEMYDQGRFFTVTGDQLEVAPSQVHERQREISDLHARLFPPQPRPTRVAAPPVHGGAVETDLLQHILASYDGHKFRRLWQGLWEEAGYESQSEADLALVGLLVKWFGNRPDVVDCLFRESALFRSKWDEKRGELTYGQRTIDKAMGVGHE